MSENTPRQTPKPVSEWGKGLGDYFASRREIDIKKAQQLYERGRLSNCSATD